MKRSITLIETIVAMTLFSLLFTTLFFWVTHLSKKPLDPPHLEQRYAIERLNSLFSKATINANQGVTTFYRSGDSLVFTFENGPFEEPLLSDVVLACLYFDYQSNALCLTIWPQPKEGKMLTTPSLSFPIIENVHMLDFAFYYPPDPFEGPVSPKEIKSTHPQSGWQVDWRPEFNCLPALVKLSINDHCYLFDFSYPIIYPAEAIL